MKFLVCGVLISAIALLCVHAEDEKKEEIKVYKRLIPADVLRGEFYCVLWAFILWEMLRRIEDAKVDYCDEELKFIVCGIGLVVDWINSGFKWEFHNLIKEKIEV